MSTSQYISRLGHWVLKVRSLSQAAAVAAILAASAGNLHAQAMVANEGQFNAAIGNVNNQSQTGIAITSGFSLTADLATITPTVNPNAAVMSVDGGGHTLSGGNLYNFLNYTTMNTTDQLTLTLTNGLTLVNAHNVPMTPPGYGLQTNGPGTLILQGDGTFDASANPLPILIDGSSILQIDSAGDLGVVGNTIFIGMNSGVLLATADVTVNNTVQVIPNGAAQFAAAAGTTLTIANPITGTSASDLVINPNGTQGTVTFVGANTYAQDTVVSDGIFRFDGSIASNNFFVYGSSTLGGDGNVVRFVMPATGTLDPGVTANSIGSITATSSVNMDTGTTFHIDFNGTSWDTLNVNSTTPTDAQILGSFFVHDLTGRSRVVAGQKYVFIHTTGGFTLAAMPTITDDLPKIDFLLGYDATDVWFYSLTSSTTYADVAQTPNELSIANYLDQTSTTANGDYLTVIDNLNSLNADQMRAAFNQMGGESFGTTGQFGIQTTTLSTQQIVNHLGSSSMFGAGGGGTTNNLMAQVSPTANRSASPNNIQLVSHSEPATAEAKKAESCALCFDTCANEKLWNAWSVGYGLGGSAQGGGGVSGASYGVGGFVAGVDRWIDDSTLFGVFGGYLGSGFSTGTPSATVHDNAGQGGIYAMRRGEVLYANALIGGQADNYTSHRIINFAAINRTAVGNYDGWQGFGYSELGANLGENKLKLQPYGALQYIHLRQNSI